MAKRWTVEQEKRLINEFKKAEGNPVVIPKMAREFGRSEEAVQKKLKRLGLNVVGAKVDLTTTIESIKELPSLEEVLKILAAALKKATEPSLGRVELQRLDTIATLYKAYESGLEKYVNYRAIEQKLIELEKKYEELIGKKA